VRSRQQGGREQTGCRPRLAQAGGFVQADAVRLIAEIAKPALLIDSNGVAVVVILMFAAVCLLVSLISLPKVLIAVRNRLFSFGVNA
jgi:hypothetical protein